MNTVLKFFKKYWFSVIFISLILLSAGLRLYKLDQVPASMYWEEVALGYDAYSLLQTGKDHHGNAWPIVAIESFGDYKPSGYFYALLPSIAVFGLNVWAVRIPSAIAGVLIVVGCGLLSKIFSQILFPEKKDSQHQVIQLIATTWAAFSPWLIQFSRGGWEVNLASCFLLWGSLCMLFYIRSAQKQRANFFVIQLVGAAALFAASMYTYHATRIIAPTVFGGLLVWVAFLALKKVSFTTELFTTHTLKLLAPILLSGLFFTLLISPLLLQSRSPVVQERFSETSITSDGHYVQVSNALREASGNSPIERVLTHRYAVLAQQLTINFFSHFRFDFLFVTGDINPRHSPGIVGLFYLTDCLFLLIGTLALGTTFYQNSAARPAILWLVWWLVIGIIPASLTMATPHELRILPAAPVFFVVLAVGVMTLLEWQKKRAVASLVGIVIFSITFGQFVRYWRYYTLIYPALSSNDWQYGYQQMVEQLKPYQDNEGAISITREIGRPAMYYWFFMQTPPEQVQAAEATMTQDKGEFLQFKNIHFTRSVDEAKRGIVVSSAEQATLLPLSFSSVQKLSEVRDPRGRVVWVISRTE